MPAFVRIITRGVLTEIRTDISALELFSVSILSNSVVSVFGNSIMIQPVGQESIIFYHQ